MLGVAVVFATAAAADAAVPPPLGDDGSYHVVRSWNTTQSEPTGFLVPSTILATTAGEIYGIANYSSGSSQAIIRDSDTGSRLASWYNPDTSPTGLALDAEENPHVLERNNMTGLWQVTTYDPVGVTLNTAVLTGSEDISLAGLALAEDGTIYTINAGASPNEIASYSSDGTARPATPLPGLQISYAAFNLNLAADGRLHFSAYSLADGNSVLVGVGTDGGGLAVTALPNAAQTTLGPNDRLFTVQYDGTIVISDTSGAVLDSIPPTAFAPSQISPIGITAATDGGTIFVSGYAYNPDTGESTPGITALQPLRSPDIVGTAFTALSCEAFSDVVTATGTPPPSFYEIISGVLPPGITLNGDTGEIAGVPTIDGDFGFTIQAFNGVTPTPDTTTRDTADYTIRVSLKTFATSAPIISGTPSEGSELTVDVAPWVPVPTEIDYVWLRDGQPIDGATSSTYTLVAADVGRDISVTVSGTADCYSPATATSAALTIPTPAPSPPPAPGPSDPGAPPHGGLAGTGGDTSGLPPLLISAAMMMTIGAALILVSRARRRLR